MKAKKTIKNALVINGVTYKVKRLTYVPGMSDPCDDCDIRRKCEKNIHGRFCAPFNGAGHVEYFKRIEQ